MVVGGKLINSFMSVIKNIIKLSLEIKKLNFIAMIYES